MTVNKQLAFEDTSNFTSLKVLYRFLQIARYYGAMDGITRAQFAYPTVQFRNVIAPSAKLPHHHVPLTMNVTEMQSMFDLGVQDALNEISTSEGVSAQEFAAITQELKKQKLFQSSKAVQEQMATIQEKLMDQILQ
jgi:hypothetical protein